MSDELETVIDEKETIQSQREAMTQQFKKIDYELELAEREAERKLDKLLNIAKPEPPTLTAKEEKELATIVKTFKDKERQLEGMLEPMEALVREMKGLVARSDQLTNGKTCKVSCLDRVSFSNYVRHGFPSTVAGIYGRVIIRGCN
ncbi:MAG: hypothetical protein KKA38_10965 [Euryarchaeota archaeon]|nr:hypothetical protein [Euryarchaeota archaeon]MBV1734246.1 hypothetical protein [Desulforudis sp.]